ncbi:hypothetical protein [Burkholderia sp. RS02]|uniref:hypothetical protein n=1 Tax=unclassified Burkholderia TaxID=2613784 RepID=UPI0032182E08
MEIESQGPERKAAPVLAPGTRTVAIAAPCGMPSGGNAPPQCQCAHASTMRGPFLRCEKTRLLIEMNSCMCDARIQE